VYASLTPEQERVYQEEFPAPPGEWRRWYDALKQHTVSLECGECGRPGDMRAGSDNDAIVTPSVRGTPHLTWLILLAHTNTYRSLRWQRGLRKQRYGPADGFASTGISLSPFFPPIPPHHRPCPSSLYLSLCKCVRGHSSLLCPQGQPGSRTDEQELLGLLLDTF
jgi:hypothetical protein